MRPYQKKNSSRAPGINVEHVDPLLPSSPTTSVNFQDSQLDMRDGRAKAKEHTAHPVLDLNLFSPDVLRDQTALDIALGSLESYIVNRSIDPESLLLKLMSGVGLFEFAISSISAETSTTLVSFIIDQFPSTASDFPNSLSSRLLYRLSRYFWDLNYPASGLSDSHRAVELAYACLQAIPGLPLSTPDADPEHFEEDEMFGIVTKKKSQRDKKRAKRFNRLATINTKPFGDMGLAVPKTKSEAEELAKNVLNDQLTVLFEYLQVLRDPQLAGKFKKAYVPEVAITQGDLDASAKNAADILVTESVGITQEASAVYSIVQPMKAALYFDTVEGFGEWRIYISTRADRNLRETRKKDPTLFKIVIKKIKELSRGHFSDDNQKRLNGPNVEIPVFEAKMTRDSRLVYQVDCMKEFDSEIEWQVLRVFGIYTHAQLDKRFWDAVGHQLGGRGKEYRKRCIFRNAPHLQKDKLIAPASFPPLSEPTVREQGIRIPDLRDEDREELHSLLVLEKFVTFSQALLNSILADQEVAHVFQMSPQEQEIVQHTTSSCYVLGRSGTGKTTTMMFKMLLIERIWEQKRKMFEGSVRKPRQLFVTQSKVLAEKVEEYYAKLSLSLAAGQRSSQESIRLSVERERKGLVDRDEEDLYRGSLPKRFGELEDSHFPLFLTYDHLCRLLEAEFGVKFGTNELDEDDTSITTDYMMQRRASFVSYQEFLSSYWPHFPQNIAKRLDPALVFAEFMGVLKGSEQTLDSEAGFLSQEEYKSLSHRSHGTFSSQRDAIYVLFQVYQRMRVEQQHYDAADRTHAIVKNLLGGGIPGRLVDFIYVDEVQDNLLIDAHILRSICSNPDGLFWAGDTAQTISAGSSFRFNDLKAFLYRVEKVRHSTDSHKQPKSFQLITNYRSHNGIVACAHSVVALITQFWPHAIDVLAEESGIVDGHRPVFFSNWDGDTVRYEQFLFGTSGSQIEFGAKQCILVRDDLARDRLRAQVGDIGLILTLYESKGLEFDDVLLYNFFEDSTVDSSQWRVILNTLPTKQVNCPRFDETRHSGVCRELKFLYVAITRARKNLWIADCSERGGPMRAVWDARDQVQNCSPGDNIPQLATTSTPEEWAETARTLFDNRRYMQAMHSYERAGLPREKAVAHAYYLREQARARPVTSRSPDTFRNNAYLLAAQAFHTSANAAGDRKDKLAYYRISGECFAEGNDYGRAGQVYLLAAEYTRSAQQYRKAGMFDEAVEVIQDHRKHISVQTAEKIIDVAKIHYFKENKLNQATSLFPSLEDAMEFMEDYEFDVARADLLEQNGRFSEAAELHFSEGHIVKAVSLLLNDPSDASRQRAQSCLLDGLWRSLSFGVTTQFQQEHGGPTSFLTELLAISKQLVHTPGITQHTVDQLQMFQAIVDRNHTMLRDLGVRFHNIHEDSASSLLCFDHVFGSAFSLQNASVFDITDVLEAFLLYIRTLARIALDWNPCQNSGIQRLFGFRTSSPNMFLVYHGSALKDKVLEGRTLVAEEEAGVVVRGMDLNTTLMKWTQQRLLTRTRNEIFSGHHAQAYSPCPAFTVLGDCARAGDCWSAHIPRSALDVDWFHARIRSIFQQMLVYQVISGLESREDQVREQKFWLSNVYHAIFPVSPRLGSVTLLNHAKIPEADQAIPILKEWLRNLFYSFDPYAKEQSGSFLLHMVEMIQLAFVFDRDASRDYLQRARCVTLRPKWLLRNQEDHGSYVIHDLIESLKSTSKDAITIGVLFLKHVSSQDSDINISALCRLVEYVCGSCAIAERMNHATLHDIALPLTWLRELCSARDAQPRETFMIYHLMQPMSDLLEKVYNGADNLLYQGGRLSKAKYQVRAIFISRICRALSFLGYNINVFKLRTSICRTVNSLKKTGQAHHPSYSLYVNAISWSNIVYALRKAESNLVSPMDEWIHLKEEKRIQGPLMPPRGVRVIVYQELSDVPLLLNGGTPERQELHADAEVFVPNLVPHVPDTEDGVEDNEMEEEPMQDADGDVAGGGQVQELEAAALSIDAGRIQQAEVALTDEELTAAGRILKFYRRIVRERKQASEARALWFLGCLKVSNSRPFRHKYRIRFLGPLPHALIFLERLNLSAGHAKKKALRRLKSEKTQHEELEKAQEQVDQARRNLREVIRLQRELSPQSSIHIQQDLKLLRKYVSEAAALGHLLGIVDDDLELAEEGIVKPKPEEDQKKKPKPELVVEDDLALAYL